MTFNREEAPVAYYMVELVKQLSNHNQPLSRPEYKPFHEFMCYWVAFNNIYTKIADNAGYRPILQTNPDGTPKKTKKIANVKIAKVDPVSEIEQMECALNNFGESLKHQLITHESTYFFLNRTPKMITIDAFGQTLNGVINVGYSVNSDYPVWSPIDKKTYEQYMKNNQDSSAKNDLAKQILFVLYTIRNNVFHAGKRGDDATDLKVVEMAVPLLSMIVLHFLD